MDMIARSYRGGRLPDDLTIAAHLRAGRHRVPREFVPARHRSRQRDACSHMPCGQIGQRNGDIIVCGHSDCGAMKALADPSLVTGMPNVAAWLRHGAAAAHVVDSCCPDLEGSERVRALSLENVAAQLAHLRTHPSVASAIARGELALHGWFVDINAGQVLGLDGATGQFVPLREDQPLPVAQPAQRRVWAQDSALEAAE